MKHKVSTCTGIKIEFVLIKSYFKILSFTEFQLVSVKMMRSTLECSLQRRPRIGLALIFLITFTVLSSAAPTEDDPSGLVLNYELGKSYIYDYETESVIKLVGTSNEESQVKLKGQALLTPTKKNDFVLTLKGFTLDISSPSGKTAAAPVPVLERSTSRFTIERGAIKEFYAPEDSSWVANYHRAIASIFSNYALQDSDSSRAFYFENDVSGKNCPTEYEISADGTFTKRRNLNKCYKRDGGFTSQQFGVPFTSKFSQEANSDNSIKSSQECTQKYANGVLSVAACREDHKVTLLTGGKDSGGNAKVIAKIIFVSTSPAQTASSIPSKLSSIFHDHVGSDALKKSSDADSSELLEKLVANLCLSTGTKGRLSSNTASAFLALRSKMGFFSRNVLESVHTKLAAGNICQAKESHLEHLVKLYVDAASMVGGSETIGFVAKLIKAGSVSVNSQKRFRLYTAFADNPSEEALSSLLEVLTSGGNLNPKYLLTASGTAHQYCFAVNTNCKTNAAYIALVNEIAKQTETNCGAVGDDKLTKAAVIGLQALGNLDSLTPNAVTTIRSCLGKSDRIKLSALQAFRRDPCQELLKSDSRKILQKEENPAHIRTAAYLALSQCYTKDDSDILRALLKTESSVQVISFIKSHRQSKWNSGNRAEIEMDLGLFDGIEGKSKFDPRKFSSSWAHTSEADSYSANVIFADDSFLPKAVYANSSEKLFGHEFGGLEIGAHLGGIEQDLLEQLYGPRGENPTKYQGHTRRRSKRQSNAPTFNQNEIDVLQSSVKRDERKVDPSDFYFRIFGTTVYANSFTLEDFLDSRRDSFDKKIENIMKGKEVDFTESYPLYGDELVIPTVSGLSLWIHNEGAAILSLKYSQTLSEDLTTFTPKFRPGVSIANNMKMTIASEILEAGLRAETKFSASTDISFVGIASATDEFSSAQIRVTLPQSEVQLVDFSNELFWTVQTRHGDFDMKTKMTTLNPPELEIVNQCSKFLQLITGIQGCIDIKLPPASGKGVPLFPLSGHGAGSLKIHTPAGAKELVVDLKFTKQSADVKERIVLIEIDTPGSSENQKVVIKGLAFRDGDNKKFSFDLDSTSIKAGVYGASLSSDSGLDTTLGAYANEKEYKVVIKLKRWTEANIKRSSHDVILSTPEQSEVQVLHVDIGKSETDSPKLYRSHEIIVKDIANNEVLTFSGTYDINFDSEGKGSDGKISNMKLTCKGKRIFLIDGVVKPGNAVGSMQLDLDTKFLLVDQEEEAKVKGELHIEQDTVTFKGSLTSSVHPLLNSNVEFSRLNSKFLKKTNLDINQVGPNSEGGVLKLSHVFDNHGDTFKIQFESKAYYPPKGLNAEKSYSVDFSDKKAEFNFHYSDGKRTSDVKFNLDKATRAYSAEITAQLNGKEITLKSQNSETAGSQIIQHSVSISNGFTAEVKTEISTPNRNGVSWKISETSVKSNQLTYDYLVTIDYDIGTSSEPKLSESGDGSINFEIKEGSKKFASFNLVNIKDSDDSLNSNIKSFLKDQFTNSLEVKASPKGKRVEISASAQSLALEKGPERIFKFVLYGTGGIGDATGNLDIDLKFNGENDASNAVKFTSIIHTQRTNSKISVNVKNLIVISEKTRNIELNVEVGLPGPSKYSVSVVYVTPEKHTLKYGLSTELEISDTTKFITLKGDVTDPETLKELKGNFELGVRNLNIGEKVFNFVSNFDYEKDGSTVPVYKIAISSGVQGATHMIDVSTTGNGITTEPITHTVRVEIGGGKYGLKIEGNNPLIYLDVKVEHSNDGNLEKYKFDIIQDSDHISAKGQKGFNIDLDVGYRFTSAKNFEVQVSSELEASTSEGKIKYTFGKHLAVRPGYLELESKNTIENPKSTPYAGNGKLKIENSDQQVSVLININHPLLSRISEDPQKRILELNFETNKDIKNIVLKLSGKVPSTAYETFYLSIDRTTTIDDTSRSISVVGKLDEKFIGVDTTLVISDPKKSVDLAVRLNKEPVRKLSLKFEPDQLSAEAAYEWGDNGQHIESKGAITKNDEGSFGAKFNFDSPALKHKWNLEVAREVSQAKESFSFAAKSPDTNQVLQGKFLREGSRKSGMIGVAADLKVDFDAMENKLDFDGSFDVKLKQAYDEAANKVIGDTSLSFKSSYVVGADKRSGSLSLNVESTDILKQFKGKLCHKDDCSDLNAETKIEQLKQNFEFSFLRGKLSASAALVMTKSGDGKTFTKIFRSEFVDPENIESRKIEVTVYKKPGSADNLELTKSDISTPPAEVSIIGIEIAVPERTYGAEVACADWTSVDAESHEAKFWFDKKNQPNQKLIFGFSNSVASVQEQGQGSDFSISVRHHKLQRDLKLKETYRYGITSKVFDFKTEIDVFKRAEDKLVINTVLIHDVASESYTLEHSVVSDGLGISGVVKCNDVKIDHPSYQGTCKVVRKVPSLPENNFKFVFSADASEDKVEVFSDKTRIFYSRNVLNFIEETSPTDSLTYKTPTLDLEIQFPGMTDTRFIHLKGTRFPFRFTLSTHPSSSKASTTFWIGATSVIGGGFGVTRHDETGAKQTLVDFGADVKHKHIEIIFDWKKDQIKEYLTYASKRGQEVQEQVGTASQKLVTDSENVEKAARAATRGALQDFEPLRQWYESQLTEILKKYKLGPVEIKFVSIGDSDTPRKSVLALFAKSLSDAVTAGADSINKCLEELAKEPTLPKPEAVKEQVAKVTKVVEALSGAIRATLENIKPLKEKFPILKKAGRKIRETIVANIQATYDRKKDDLNSMLPYPEVRHFLDHFNDYIEIALLEPEKITKPNRTEMLEDFSKAVEQIFSKTYSLNFAQGRLSAEIPLLLKGEGEQMSQYGDDAKEQTKCILKMLNDPGSTLPPVNATAFLIGNSEYVTFDGTSGRFEKTCQYLLASDFVNQNFSVIFDLGTDTSGQGEGSALLITDHKTSMGLYRSEDAISIIVNGKVVSLDSTNPIAQSGAFIGYSADGFKIIEGDMGVTIGCEVSFDLCFVQVSGFYHGKLSGVLGKFNNEPNDDRITTTGTVTTNEGVFQKSWKLNKSCAGKSIRKPEGTSISDLANTLGREDLDIDTFFSRLSDSPHRLLPRHSIVMSSATYSSVLSLFPLVALSILTFLFNRLRQ